MFFKLFALATAGLVLRTLLNHWILSSTGVHLVLPPQVVLPTLFATGLLRLLALNPFPFSMVFGFLVLDLPLARA